MTPKLLVLQAYTAFAERQLIDFRRLGERKYMISGDTGAGKRILDAMTYALSVKPVVVHARNAVYGVIARAGMSTFVDFRFELHGTYCVLQTATARQTHGTR